MKKNNYIIPIALLACCLMAHAQSIRKDYRHMTNNEKANLREAFINNQSPIAAYVEAHGKGDRIHMQSDFNRDIFLSWHRMFVLELEQDFQGGQNFQNTNQYVSIPYWDWPKDKNDKPNSPDYWNADDFLGDNIFNSSNGWWDLGRYFGSQNRGSIPTPQLVNTTQNITTFSTYTRRNETRLHNPVHVWVGSTMNNVPSAPQDPIFFLHHAMVDKLFQNWTEANNVSSGDNLYVRNPMSAPYANLDPDDVLDSRDLGVFYAETDGNGNKLANMTNYSVQSINNKEETFFYQYEINAGSVSNNFTVPSSGKAIIQSTDNGGITLKPGFYAYEGSSLILKIEDVPVTPTTTPVLASVRNANNQNRLYDIKVFPNPASNNVTVNFGSNKVSSLAVVSLDGKLLLNKININTSSYKQDISALQSGMYLFIMTTKTGEKITKRIIKN